MNVHIMKACGFEDEVNKVRKGICPFCNRKVERDDFRDAISAKEYRISGLCQECQDNTFGGGE